jgi:hypothetical protein
MHGSVNGLSWEDVSYVLTKYLCNKEVEIVLGEGWNQIDIPSGALRFSIIWGSEMIDHSEAQGNSLRWAQFC